MTKQELRQFFGYKQKDIAEQCNCSNTTISKFELGFNAGNKQVHDFYNNMELKMQELKRIKEELKDEQDRKAT